MPIVISGTNGISGVDGTASNPSYEGTDANTGVFFPAADTVAIATGGSERVRVDSSGNLLVGRTNTTIANNIGTIVAPTFTSIAGNSNGTLFLRNCSATVAADIGGLLRFDAVYRNSDSDVTDIAGVAGLRENATSGNYAGYLAFSTTPNGGSRTERIRIDSSGNVGIGTSSPGYTAANRVVLQVNGSTSSLLGLAYGGTNAGYLYADSTGTTLWSEGSRTLTVGVASTGNVEFKTNNTERARITSAGYSKFSNDGTYYNSTGIYHEFRQTANDVLGVFTNTNASFSAYSIGVFATRSASSAYTFLQTYSSGISDVEFNLRGDGNGYADGAWINNGADYAEFFESVDGQILTVGSTVVLDNNKVREATSQDPASAIIGVVRPKEPNKASMVIGNSAWNKWANKFLTDDFDRYIMEDHDVLEWTDDDGKQHSHESHNIPDGVTVPEDATRKTHDDKGNKFQHYKLNPAWDKDAEYTPREQRPEWNIIGLIGQVKVLKGQPVNDRWIKMRDVSDTVEEWFIR